MKIPSILVALGLALLLPAPSSAKSLENIDAHGVGIQGYDPVAYFSEGKPLKGKPEFQSSHAGVIYFFASSGHKAMFDVSPEKFVPQFGGFCAYGASKGSVVEIDPTAFEIVDGRLLLQYSHGILEKFNKDTTSNLHKADVNWGALVEKKGR